LAEDLLFVLLDLQLDPVHRPVGLQDGLHRLGDLGSTAVACPWGSQLLLELGQVLPGPLELPRAGQGVPFGLARAVIPLQPIPLDTGRRRLADAVPIDEFPLLIVLIVNPSPPNPTPG